SARQRIAVIDRLAETDVARDGATLWTYQSGTNTATLQSLAALAQNEIALTLLRDVLLPIVTGPDSVVSVGPTDVVAGQDAYTLLVRPRRGGSLVDRLELTVDAARGALLRVRLYAV